MKAVYIFEDDAERRRKLKASLVRRLRNKAQIEAIDSGGEQAEGTTYEAIIFEKLKNYGPGGALVLCDKDLSKMTGLIGLSASVVSAVADRLGLPLCLYARGEGEPQGEDFLRSLAPWEKKRIVLNFESDKRLAEDCATIYRGFWEITREYSKFQHGKTSTPARILATILNKSSIEDRVALYGSGEQGILEEIMPFLGKEAELRSRMPRILGNWLYTSILRFPGILVSKVAAASYLNIEIEDFLEDATQKLFARCRYRGPFSKMRPYWWRSDLDDLLDKNGCNNGLELCKKKGLECRPCLDLDANERAGYYCMVTKKPVSEGNSRGGISWFPAGADLSRIRNDKFKELAPWIGLY